jgi:hypothetical protein
MHPNTRIIVLSILLGGPVVIPACAQSPSYHAIHSADPLQDRIAYRLTLLQSDEGAKIRIGQNSTLNSLQSRLTDTRKTLFTSCRTTTVCRVDSMMLTQDEIDEVARKLAEMAKPRGPLNSLVRDQMRPSGAFQKYATSDDSAMIEAAWREIASGINRLYRVYGEEESYKMPNDGPSFGIAVETPDRLKAALASEIDGAQDEMFFSPWSRLGLDLLVVYQRTESIRYEPLDEGENAAALNRARSIDWQQWPHSAIVVPGSGLNVSEIGLSPAGAFEIRMAVRRWHEGLAPFLLVSGGHVHPNRTPYDEAIEMKRELMTHFAVPESNIVIDPYARHTTTNVRNAVRLLYRMGAPMDKSFVITTFWAESLRSTDFSQRCWKELGYLPAEMSGLLSSFDVTAQPNILSLHIDPQDPLDP